MARFIMAGRWQAIAFTGLFALLSLLMPPFAFFSSAAVALVTLRQGVKQALIVTLAASVILALATIMLPVDAFSGFMSGLQQWLPMIFLAALLTRSVSWTYTLQIMLLIVAGGLIIFHLSVSDPQQFWKALLEPFLTEVLQASNKEPANSINIAEIVARLSVWASVIVAIGLSVTWIISLFIARYWQSLLYHPNGFGEEFRDLRMGKLPALLLLGVVLLYVLSDQQLFADLALLGMTFFAFHGLGLMHGLVKKMQMSQAWLIAMYVLLIPLFPSSIIMLILLVSFGIIDSFADFRNTLAAKKD